MNYRVLQVAVLLLAAGTILGGLWADVSWGRFWGWDPKEVGALIALLVIMTALHGRRAGWPGDLSLAIGSVRGFCGVIWAWYVVNFILNAGKHAYATADGGQWMWVVAIAGIQLLFVGRPCAGNDRNRGFNVGRFIELVADSPILPDLAKIEREPRKNRVAGDGLRVVKETLIVVGPLLENSILT